MNILEVEAITKRFGGLTAINSVDFYIKEREIFGIIGPNGAGKTTMFNVVSGALKPSEGNIIFNGENITRLTMNRVAKKGLTRTFQASTVWKEETVLENVLLASYLQRKTSALSWLLNGRGLKAENREIKQKANEILEFMGLKDWENEVAVNLPHGKLRALGICIAMMTDPKVLLLDEPVTGMNPVEKQEIVVLLQRLRESGLTIAIIEHDMTTIMNLVDRIVVLDHGEKIAEGFPEAIRNDRAVIEAYLGPGGNN